MSTYTKIKTLPLSLFNNAEYLSFMNHVLDLANGNSGGGDSESPDEISLLTGSDGIPELGLTKEFLDTYEADLLAMADVVDESRTSQETEQMALHDTNRDNLAIYIITRISRAGTLPLEAEGGDVRLVLVLAQIQQEALYLGGLLRHGEAGDAVIGFDDLV